MSLLAISTTLKGILFAIAIVGGVGLIIGIALGIAGKFLAVEVDEKEVAIREALPGNNCGGCGYVTDWRQPLRKVKVSLQHVLLVAYPLQIKLQKF